MSKFKFFLICLIIGILSSAGYVWYSIDIYSIPKMTFASKDTSNFLKKRLDKSVYCFYRQGLLSPVEQTHFRLLVWNIHKGQDQGWQDELSKFVKGKDFLFLQEVSSQQNIEQTFSSQFPTLLYTRSFAYLGQQSGVALLSHLAPQSFCQGASVEPWIRIPKVGNAMIFPLSNGQSLLVMNLHLVNFELNPTDYQTQLESMFKLLANHQGPIILAGDFNTWNQGRINLIKKLTALYGLQEVQFQPDERLRFFSNPLDWAFVRGFNIKEAYTIRTTSSDHNPLLVELELITPQQ